ncbi:calcineurin-like phosphoesterase family protein [Paenibacillus sp. LBL]|uniref:metallophosphoesterase n=1 Tax=Paenibacillus sp. LBL TaxID=2940563 RepID=UPI0024733D23|nr:metallophosphoesterase [Paenibacillus sp. LBL]MDH6674293.1 calcineurin-like phosphoesterase family protein [Paenibacillus sp. LBL]
MSNTWFISDTHFGHKNIINYENRPFTSTYEMDEVMIENWNKVVKPNDVVYHLGDVFIANKERQQEIMKRLNGHVILRLGNHDKATVTSYLKLGFYDVYKHNIFVNIESNLLALSHYPINEDNVDPSDNGLNLIQKGLAKNLHGHVHSQIQELDQSIYKCVSVELTNYTPIHVDEIAVWLKS